MSIHAFRRAGWVAAAGLAASLVVSAAQTIPASAAPSTKYYTAGVSASDGTAPGVSSVSVTSGTPFEVWLNNAPDSNQSFGSAEVTVPNVPAGDIAATTSTSGWSANVLASGTVLLTSASSADAIAPGQSVGVELTVQTAVSNATVATTVKQSNDYNGTNNWFTLSGSEPTVTVTDCTSSSGCTLTSSSTGVTANVQLNTLSTSYSAYFSGASMNCDSQVTGSHPADQLYVDVTGTVTKTVTMTFPKAVVNELPNNGTPLMPVCFGSDHSFPGWSPSYSVYENGPPPALPTEYEGLLLDCSNTPTTGYDIYPCVQSRSKLPGGAEQIVVFTLSSSVDYSGYW